MKNNKKKQAAVAAMAAVLSFTTIAGPLSVMAQEDNPVSPAIIQQENGQLETAPDIILPENLQAAAGTALREIELPENWTWADDSTVITAETAEYPARFHVDDVTYNYSGGGYNAEEHYVERMVTVNVEPAQSVQKQTRMLDGNMPTIYDVGDIEINETNFPDKEFREYVTTKFDKDKDGSLSTTEIAGITSLSLVSEYAIKNLKGIEYFTALTSLNCAGSGVESLDISKNTALTSLNCYNTKIESLDVSQNTALKDLYCYNTKIKSLDVSQNKVLATLECNDNSKLTSLNVSGATALSYFKCGSTGITSLDVSQNKALNSLYCAATEIKSLDVSNNTELGRLECNNNKNLTSLNVSGAMKLYLLKCGDNPLAYLNIGEKKKLSSVNKSNLQPVNIEITGNSFDMEDKFAGIDKSKISNVQGATYDNSTGIMSNCSIGTPITYTYDCGTSKKGAETIDVTLNIKRVENIQINADNFPDEAFRTWLKKQDYGDDGTITQAEIANITSIDVGSNRDIKDLKGIEHFTALEKLSCYSTGITSLDVSHNVALTYLACSSTEITSLDVSHNVALRELVCHTTKITSLDVSHNAVLTSISYAQTPLGCLNIGTNVNLVINYQPILPPVGLVISEDTFNITDKFAGINKDKITIKSGADYDSSTGIMSNYSKETPIIYTYDCGITRDGKLTITVTLDLGCIEINETNFPDEAFRTWIGQQTYGKDGKITQAEIANIKTINVGSNWDIKDLTGIEYFTALTTLKCPSIWITSLDVSSNKALTTLDCSRTPLAYLNIGTNSNLATVTKSSLKPVSLNITENSFNMEDKFPGIDKSKITIKSGADYDSATGIMSNYNIGTPITYTYDCGTSSGETKQTIDVTLNLKDTRGNSTISIIANLNKTYDGTAVSAAPEVNKTGSTGAVSYKWEKKTSKTDWEEIASAPTDAGTYRVTAALASDSNYKSAASTSEFTIAQADSTISVTANLSKTYDGAAVTDTPTVSKTGSAGAVSYKWEKKTSETDWEEITSAPTDAGTYRVTAALASSGNYKGVTSDAKEFAIAQAENGWTENLAVTGWTYGETANKPTAAATYGTVMFSYCDSETGTYTDIVPTNVGTWYVKAVVEETDNYKGLTSDAVSFRIEKAQAPAVILPDNLSGVYDASLSTVDLPAGWAWVDGDTQLTIDNMGYQARLTVDDSNYDYTGVDGYNDVDHYVEKTLTVTVSEAENTWTQGPAIADWTYGETASEPTAIATYGTAAFTYSDSENGTFTADKPVKAGTWYLKAVVTATEKYTGLNTVISFVIAPKNTTSDSQITVPEINADTDLDKLVIKDGDTVLVQGIDYDVTKTQDGGKVTVTITFKGNYTGTITRTYTIEDNTPAGGDKDKDNNKPNGTKTDNKNTGNKKAVQTGDTTSVGLWSALLAFSAGAAVFLKRKKHGEGTEE